MFDNKRILVTGGAGFLGRAIVKRAVDENWNCSFTVFSRDTTKHHFMKRMFPDADIRYVAGDIQDYIGLYNAIVGHDIVIHAAAYKYVPESVLQPSLCYSVNVVGSQNVLNACVEAGVEKVMGISTDKACHPIQPYGASKMMMESVFREYARTYPDVSFHLVRYGNVLSSTGSFIAAWRKDIEELGYVRAVYAAMTRFWLTQDMAVEIILRGLEQNSGNTYIPRLKACSMGDIAGWIVPEGIEVKWQGNRGGEKTHEWLVSDVECAYGLTDGTGFIIPNTVEQPTKWYYGSDIVERLTKEEFLEMIGE